MSSMADSASVASSPKTEHMKKEIASSSTLSSLGSEMEPPFTPVRPRRNVTAPKPFVSPSKTSVSKEIPQRPKRRSPVKKKKAKAPKKLTWDAESIMKDPKSPLATANLRSILCDPIAWTILDQDDRAEILALFPDENHILDSGTENARPNFESLMNDDSFRYDCAAYTENIAEGRHDPEWLASAWSAHERRKAGDFDQYLVDRLEEEWGVEIPEERRNRKRLHENENEIKADGNSNEHVKREEGVSRGKKLDDRMDIDELMF